MNKRLRRIIFVILWAGCSCWTLTANLAAQTSATATPAASQAAGSQLFYLTGNEKVWADFPKAPALGSAIDESDLSITLTAQTARADAQIKEALLDKEYSIKLVTAVIDPAFDTKYPHVFQVLTQADDDAKFVKDRLKTANARLRPFVQHPILVQPVFTATDFSYPSGHSTGSELQARILGLLFPDQADALLKRARQIADSRVVAGVHYASDIAAGLTLGDLVFTQLETNDKFKSDLSAAAKLDNLLLKNN